MSSDRKWNRAVSRRQFLRVGAAGLAGGLLRRSGPLLAVPSSLSEGTVSHIYHARNGTPAQNVAQVFEMAYGGIENVIAQDDVVLLRPNLQWPRNGYTNSEIGLALIDLILRRPGGFTGEIIVIENTHHADPHIDARSGWCTADKDSNGPYNWFEVIQHFVDRAADYPNGIHTDPVTGQINVTFQFLLSGTLFDPFTLEDPHPILSTYGGKTYAGAEERLYDGATNPFPLFKAGHPTATCLYVRRIDLQYSNAIARVSPLNKEYYMNYPVVKSQHGGLYVSLCKDHPTAWDPTTEDFTAQRVRLINMTTLNHHGVAAGVTSVVKGHFGMVYPNFHSTGWDDTSPRTLYYLGGPVGYWMANVRRADLHMSCAERVGREGRQEADAFLAKSVAISTDPVALDYYAGKYILFPAGGMYGEGGSNAEARDTNDPSYEEGYYGLTIEFCRDPLADHSIVNGTLNENEMQVHLYDFERPPGDLDGDGDVDHDDYRRWHTCHEGPGIVPSETECGGADLNEDSEVDLSDLSQFLDHFGGPS